MHFWQKDNHKIGPKVTFVISLLRSYLPFSYLYYHILIETFYNGNSVDSRGQYSLVQDYNLAYLWVYSQLGGCSWNAYYKFRAWQDYPPPSLQKRAIHVGLRTFPL